VTRHETEAVPDTNFVEVTRWNLEMTSVDDHRRGRAPSVEPTVLEAQRPAPELSAFFYRLVGGPWHWKSRLVWSDEQWNAWANRPEQHLHTCWVDGVPAGYVELEQQGDDTEIAYFGLVEAVHGQGLGGWFLSYAIDRAWELPTTKRVWLNTCSDDGPHALNNYQARGFEVFSTETYERAST